MVFTGWTTCANHSKEKYSGYLILLTYEIHRARMNVRPTEGLAATYSLWRHTFGLHMSCGVSLRRVVGPELAYAYFSRPHKWN
jgi:hypothetical protein